jgi:hypothetical protein
VFVLVFISQNHNQWKTASLRLSLCLSFLVRNSNPFFALLFSVFCHKFIGLLNFCEVIFNVFFDKFGYELDAVDKRDGFSINIGK